MAFFAFTEGALAVSGGQQRLNYDRMGGRIRCSILSLPPTLRRREVCFLLFAAASCSYPAALVQFPAQPRVYAIDRWQRMRGMNGIIWRAAMLRCRQTMEGEGIIAA
jgi:hypothetical protein